MASSIQPSPPASRVWRSAAVMSRGRVKREPSGGVPPADLPERGSDEDVTGWGLYPDSQNRHTQIFLWLLAG
jgi:hypothetical protein